MQIEGDGKSHPIFRVGNTTRSIEPTSVNQNSDITSDKDSIYENKPAYNVKISIAVDFV